jgi:hypothetical protein
MNAPSSITFAIPDQLTGSEIIARLPLANPEQAGYDLNRLLDSLLANPPDSETYYRLLEQARMAAAFIASELAKRYLNKSLPLADLEEVHFRHVVGTWLKMAKAYAHCANLEPPVLDPNDERMRIATLLQRCIHYTGLAIIEHQRAHREYPWGLWLDLHGYYASAEEWEVGNLVVQDLYESQTYSTHCTAAYLSVLLCDMAGCFGLPVRQQVMLHRWSIIWAPLVSLHRVNPGEMLPQQLIDLMHDGSLRAAADCLQTDQLRRLDTTRLAGQISQVRHQLRLKVPPAQLALGEDCTAGQCNRLLEHLSRPWSQAKAARKFKRRNTTGTARLCTGFLEMHYFISGRTFEQPENVRAYARREFESLFIFREQANPQQMLQLRQEQLNFSSDAWEVVNQSANGFRLVRSISGRKMVHGQLLALFPHDGERVLLAKATWLMQEKGGGLIAGLETLPGMPAAIAIRPADQAGELASQYHPGFLLPAIPAVGSEQSLILPTGWYRPGRILDLFTDGVWPVKLTQVIDDGPDFERVGFVVT